MEETVDKTRWRWCLGAFITGACLSLLWGGASWLLKPDRFFSNEAQERLFSIAVPVQIILYGIVSPVVEEILFRGALFHVLQKILPWGAAAIITSAVFAVFHGNVIQMLYAFPMGMVFQLFLKKSGSLMAPAACHAGSNITSVIVMAMV